MTASPLATVALVVLAAAFAAHGASAPAPNIILVVADDLGWGDLGAWSSSTVRPRSTFRPGSRISRGRTASRRGRVSAAGP